MSAATTLGVLVLASFLAAAVNAMAGGGTFITFPALTALAKLTEKVANVTSTREALGRLERRTVIVYAGVGLAGGVAGAILLLTTSTTAFAKWDGTSSISIVDYERPRPKVDVVACKLRDRPRGIHLFEIGAARADVGAPFFLVLDAGRRLGRILAALRRARREEGIRKQARFTPPLVCVYEGLAERAVRLR